MGTTEHRWRRDCTLASALECRKASGSSGMLGSKSSWVHTVVMGNRMVGNTMNSGNSFSWRCFNFDFHEEFWRRCWSIDGWLKNETFRDLLSHNDDLDWNYWTSILIDWLHARVPIVTGGFARTSVDTSTRRFALPRLRHFSARVTNYRAALGVNWTTWCRATVAVLWLTRHWKRTFFWSFGFYSIFILQQI